MTARGLPGLFHQQRRAKIETLARLWLPRGWPGEVLADERECRSRVSAFRLTIAPSTAKAACSFCKLGCPRSWRSITRRGFFERLNGQYSVNIVDEDGAIEAVGCRDGIPIPTYEAIRTTTPGMYSRYCWAVAWRLAAGASSSEKYMRPAAAASTRRLELGEDRFLAHAVRSFALDRCAAGHVF